MLPSGNARGKCDQNQKNVTIIGSLKDDWSNIFKSAIHERLYKKILLFNDVETNPGPFYVDSCKTVKGSFHQGDEELFGINFID